MEPSDDEAAALNPNAPTFIPQDTSVPFHIHPTIHSQNALQQQPVPNIQYGEPNFVNRIVYGSASPVSYDSNFHDLGPYQFRQFRPIEEQGRLSNLRGNYNPTLHFAPRFPREPFSMVHPSYKRASPTASHPNIPTNLHGMVSVPDRQLHANFTTDYRTLLNTASNLARMQAFGPFGTNAFTGASRPQTPHPFGRSVGQEEHSNIDQMLSELIQRFPQTDDTETESENERRYSDYHSSHSTHEDTPQQMYFEEPTKLEVAAGWRYPLDTQQTSEHSDKKGFYNPENQSPYSNRPHYENRSGHFGRSQLPQHVNPTEIYRLLDSEFGRSQLPQHVNPTESYRLLDSDFGRSQLPQHVNPTESYRLLDSDFGRSQLPQHVNPTESYRLLDSEHSSTLPLQQNWRPVQHSAREDARGGRKKSQKKSRRKHQEDYAPSYRTDYSSCNEESGASGSCIEPNPHLSNTTGKYRKNSSGSSKQSYKDAISEVEPSIRDDLISEELSNQIEMMSIEQSASGSASGISKKGKKIKQKGLCDKNKDNQTRKTAEDSGRTRDESRMKVQQQEGAIGPAGMAEGLKLIDPRMEREREHRSNDPVASTSYRSSPTKTITKMEVEFQFWFANQKYFEELNVVNELEADLFEQPDNFSLAHCVAEDMRMGIGIARMFRIKFNNVGHLLDQRAKPGGLAIIHDETNNRYIYYLVTKEESHFKPSYYDLWMSMCKWRDHIIANQVKKIATPRLGCGFDHLEWYTVKSMIQFMFKDIDIEYRVCNLKPSLTKDDKKSKCKIIINPSPITDVPDGTLILYFTTLEEDPDRIMRHLAKRSYDLLVYYKQHRPQKLTDLVYHYDVRNNLGLIGCCVRYKTTDPMNFKCLQKCLEKVNDMKLRVNDVNFRSLAFQIVDRSSYNDTLINEKIITLIMNTLKNVVVDYCKGFMKDVEITNIH